MIPSQSEFDDAARPFLSRSLSSDGLVVQEQRLFLRVAMLLRIEQRAIARAGEADCVESRYNLRVPGAGSQWTIATRGIRAARYHAANVSHTLKRTHLPLRCRLDLLTLALLRDTYLAEAFPLHVPSGPIFVGRETLEIDLRQFDYIFDGPHYDIAYQDAAVLDIGAHKGYFGAYALGKGAASVISFEPESQNFRFLSYAARRARRRGRLWEARKEAVGSAADEADLFISRESWGHSLSTGASVEIGDGRRERVRVIALEPLLTAPTGKRLIVKLNVEGAECDIVQGTPALAWRRVDVLIIELHPWAPCSAAAIEAHLTTAGLLRQRTLGEANPVLHFGRDPVASRPASE